MSSCRFISGAHLMPGWMCCHCSGYNGLQREQCRHCGHAPEPFTIPDYVRRCPGCGWGWVGKTNWTTSLEGKDLRGQCPCCGLAFPAGGPALA